MFTSATPKIEPSTFGELKVGDKFTITDPASELWNMKVAPAVLYKNLTLDVAARPYNAIRLNNGDVRTFADSHPVDKFVGPDIRTL